MTDIDELRILLEKKEHLVAMVAPSFPLMYSRPEIIAKLKALGFEKVIEVSAGAKRTNEQVAQLLKNNPQGRYITSPCASFVRYVRTKHPEMLKYLAFQADSPMVATAKMVHEKFPDYRPVFVGPCIVKKLEASEDYPELGMVVVTYKELNILLKEKNLEILPIPEDQSFDIEEKATRIYPYDGGLTDSGGIRNVLSEEEIRVVSGYKNCEATLKEFMENTKIRFVDILFCEGGCINGPGVQSTLTLEERKKKIQEYAGQP